MAKKKIDTNTIRSFIIPRTDKLDDESKQESQTFIDNFCKDKTNYEFKKATPGSIIITNNILCI